MGIAVFLLVASGAAAAAAAAGFIVRVNTRKSKPNPKPHSRARLLPRAFLIACLQDRLGQLPSVFDFDKQRFGDFCRGLTHVLGEIKDVILEEMPRSEFDSHEDQIEEGLDTVPDDAVWRSAVERVATVIDGKLVVLLQKVPGLVSLLDGYLPKFDQTWDALPNEELSSQDDDGGKLSGDELPDELPDELQSRAFQMELMSSCLHSIELLIRTLDDLENKFSDFEPSRIAQEGDVEFMVFDEVLVPSTCKFYNVVKVFYATDRQVTEDGEYIGKFSKRNRLLPATDSNHVEYPGNGMSSPATPKSLLHFGVMEVGIPVSHKEGSTEVPRGGEEADPMNHVVILSVDTKLRDNKEGFLQNVKHDLLATGAANEVLVFIHGYNVSHKQAVKRAAQLKHDLKFAGVVVAYSWSSRGDLKGYLHDQKSVAKTVPHLEDFLRTITTRMNDTRVHILAHSMGNRALIGALTKYLRVGGINDYVWSHSPFAQIIFAAADEEREKFEKLLTHFHTAFGLPNGISLSNGFSTKPTSTGKIFLRPHLTVYSSTEDAALHLSKVLHFRIRLGDTRSLFASTLESGHDDSDVVDATGVDDTFLGHSYFGSTPKVIDDIRVLLADGTPAKERKQIHQIEYAGKQFYTFCREKWHKARTTNRRVSPSAIEPN